MENISSLFKRRFNFNLPSSLHGIEIVSMKTLWLLLSYMRAEPIDIFQLYVQWSTHYSEKPSRSLESDRVQFRRRLVNSAFDAHSRDLSVRPILGGTLQIHFLAEICHSRRQYDQSYIDLLVKVNKDRNFRYCQEILCCEVKCSTHFTKTSTNLLFFSQREIIFVPFAKAGYLRVRITILIFLQDIFASASNSTSIA